MPQTRESLQITLRRWLKTAVLDAPLLGRGASAALRRRLHRDYERRADDYARRAQAAGLSYDENRTEAEVRGRLQKRGWSARRRTQGEAHTFAFIPGISWHASLLPDLEELGPVSRFDYAAHGYSWDEFARATRRGLRERDEMNELFLKTLREAHARRPVDWVLVYASGCEVKAATIRRIADELGLPTVNLSFDDKQSWSGPWMGDHPGGQIGLAPAFDLTVTGARVACEWYLVEGGRPLCLPPAFDASSFRHMDVEKDIPISFIGEAYGTRKTAVAALRRRGIPLQTFGRGWGGEPLPHEEMIRTINRSRLNLGMGGILHSDELVNLKGRDFEIPAIGGGAYVTSFNPDLAEHFDVGREILCYRGHEDLVDLIRRLLSRPEEADEVARRGRERCLRDHRWLHRYRRICRLLGVL